MFLFYEFAKLCKHHRLFIIYLFIYAAALLVGMGQYI